MAVVMVKKIPEQNNHAWLVVFLVLLSMAVFLLVIITIVPRSDYIRKQSSDDVIDTMIIENLSDDVKKTTTEALKDARGSTSGDGGAKNGIYDTTVPPYVVTTPPPIIPDKSGTEPVLYKDDNLVTRADLLKCVQKWVRSHFQTNSKPRGDGSLGGHLVQSVAVDRNFYIYDVKMTYDASRAAFLLTILMELPTIQVVLYQPYSTFYPTLNPYIHVVEITFQLDTHQKYLSFVSIDITMVDWKVNRYKTMYEETKNSPVCLPTMPKPIRFTKMDLSSFILSHQLFHMIPFEDDFDVRTATIVHL